MFNQKDRLIHFSLKIKLFIVLGLFVTVYPNVFAQRQKLMNQPFADQKLYHFGFFVGVNLQDFILSNTGHVNEDQSVWFSEIPSYSPGFTVGIIADRYISQYFNLRITPSLHFGEKKFVFKEEQSNEEFRVSAKTNYISFPIHMRFSAVRLNNFRPYILAGGYISSQIGGKKKPVLKFHNLDYGLEFGLGCNFYFPLFKLSPELKFSFGLKNLLQKDRFDLDDKDLIKYTDALGSTKSRMISLVFNFE